MGASTSIEGCLPVTRNSEAFKKLLEALRGVIVGYEEYQRAREAEAEAAAFAKAEADAETAGRSAPKVPTAKKRDESRVLVSLDVSDRVTLGCLRQVLVDDSRRSLSHDEFNTMCEDLDIDPKDSALKISLVDIAQVVGRIAFCSLLPIVRTVAGTPLHCHPRRW